MGKKGITEYFENYLVKELLFKNKKIMQDTYDPQEILHRDKELTQIARILAPTLRSDKPSNLFVFGSPGTGKTVVVKHTCKKLSSVAKAKDLPVRIEYVNCKMQQVADTQYRLVAELAKRFGKAVPSTGLPTREIYQKFISAVDKEPITLILILDEIDQLIDKAGGGMLYNLTRFNSELKQSQITFVGISNSARFLDDLDLRTHSSLSMESILFNKYNALQLQDILRKRAHLSFTEKAISPGLIEKCAAIAAKRHGDARLAISLLRVAGELAERQNSPAIYVRHLDEAEDKIENDNILDTIGSHPQQYQIVLFAAMILHEKQSRPMLTGELYDIYAKLCTKIKERPLTQRRVSDIIAELDMLGILRAKISSKGRYGRTKEITVAIPSQVIGRARRKLEQNLALA